MFPLSALASASSTKHSLHFEKKEQKEKKKKKHEQRHFIYCGTREALHFFFDDIGRFLVMGWGD